MIAVTGANGLLGSFIVRKLHETHTPLVALKRKSSDTSLLSDLNDSITWRDADLLDPVSLRESLSGVEGVIHSAALVSFNPWDARKMIRANVEGTKNVVDTCLIMGIKRLLHVSSVAALGRVKDQTLITETNQWKDSPCNTFYGESKYNAELEVFRAQEEGISTVIVNPSVILARGNWQKSSARIFKYVWQERPFYTDGCINFVDVRDVASLVHQLYHSSYEGERFILNAGSLTLKEFFDKTALALQKKAPRIKVSKSVLRTIARLESLRAILTGTDPLITRETARMADSFFHYDNQKVTTALGYQFQPLDQTLEWCAEFYKKQTKLKN